LKNKTITIFEDYPSDLLNYEEHLENLKPLKNIIGSNNYSLQADGTIQIKHYVGFYQRGNTRLQILPKIYSKSNDGLTNLREIESSLDFIYRMLYYSGYLQHKDLPPQEQSTTGTDLLEIFIQIFIEEFIHIFKHTIFRNYQQFENNQSFIKGKIMFSETVRRNPILHHLHIVRFDEYTINNPLNQIFKATIFQLLQYTKSSTNKKCLVMGLNYLQEVDLIYLHKNLFARIKFDRLNAEFEPLFKLANLFFHNQQPGLSEGKDITFSFLVPLNLLFETYVAKILDKYNELEAKFNYHSPQYFLGTEGSKKVFQLEPDFTIMYKEKCLCILDTKYKYPYNASGEISIATSDLYQMTTYAYRYDCRNVILIYPLFIGQRNKDVVISEYILHGGMGDIALKVMQIDIVEKDINILANKIISIINPMNKQQINS
jgi:5-methylcytosine-specific restriction enzyme subunit McrC